MKKLKYTKKQAISLHRKMWRELAESGDADKPRVEAKNNCFACQYARDKAKPGVFFCHDCPFQWPINSSKYSLRYVSNFPCVRTGSSYYNWVYADSKEERKLFAREIANLPIRKTDR